MFAWFCLYRQNWQCHLTGFLPFQVYSVGFVVEVNGRVPEENERALEDLIEVCHLHILSYVGSRRREKQVWDDVLELRCANLLAGIHTCWAKCGHDGKAAWTKHLGGSVIIDNDAKIINECLQDSNLMVLAIKTPYQQHGRLAASMVFETFDGFFNKLIKNGGPGFPGCKQIISIQYI